MRSLAVGLLIGLGLGTMGAEWPVRPVLCAQRVGVAWSAEQGATERLAAFSACVNR